MQQSPRKYRWPFYGLQSQTRMYVEATALKRNDVGSEREVLCAREFLLTQRWADNEMLDCMKRE